MHKVGIRIRDRLYKRLPHVKKKALERQRRYFPQYYKKHRDEISKRAVEWNRVNKERRRIINKRYKEKLKKMCNMKSKLERVINEFLDYCKDRYDAETVGHYEKNMHRFYNYIEQHKTRCKEYHDRNYKEYKKPENERDFSWRKEYRRIQYVEEIDRDFITRYVRFVNHDEINNNTGLSLSQSEKESRLYPLKTFLLYCQRKGYIKQDLRRFIIVPPREKKVLKRALTVDEVKELIEMPDTNKSLGIRDRAILELSYSGLRAEEILALKVMHIDAVTNAVTILDGKGDKDRVVPMTSEAIYWIKRWLNRRHEFIGSCKDPEYLFITKSARPIERKNFSVLIKKYAKKANISIDISPRDLRRTTATHLAENGAPIRLIQALLGHSMLKVTTKYLRLSDEKIKEEYKRSHPSNRRKLHYGNIRK